MKKRILYFVAVICLIVGILPLNAYAYTQGYDGMGPVYINNGQRDFKWPVPDYYNLKSCFYDHRNHCAIDIAAPKDTSVVASYTGTVYKAVDGGTSYYGDDGFGNYVVLEHKYSLPNGTITLYTRYSHLNSVTVKEGLPIQVGEEVGKIGTTGSSEGYHLDFQILYGDWQPYQTYSIDPYANQLLELPSNLEIYDSWDCGKTYYALAKEIYSVPLPSNDLSKVTKATYTSYGTGTINTSNAWLKSLPCSSDTNAASENVRSEAMAKNEKVTITQLILNTAGNYWYKVKADTDGLEGYLYAGDVDFSAKWDAAISEPRYPTKLDSGKAFSIGGTVYANNTELYEVTGAISGAKSFSKTVSASGSYRLMGSTIDAALLFNELPAGTYTYSVKANCRNYYSNGTSLLNKTYNKTVHSNSFTVGSQTCDHTYSSCVTTPSTCTQEGIITYTCTKCGYSHTESVPANGHAYGGWSTTKNPTCTDSGTKKQTCYYCGDTQTQSIPATGHSLTHHSTKAATCTAAGNKEYWYCSRCGKYFTNSSATTETTLSKLVLDKVDHSYSNGICKWCGVSQTISGFCGGEGDGSNLMWTLDGEGTLTITGTGPMADYASVTNHPWYIMNDSIKKVIIGDGVTTIGDDAFIHCDKLTSATIGGSVTIIDQCAFWGCSSLAAVSIPDSVTTIDDEAFAACESLTDIYVDDRNTAYCDIDGVLYSKNKSKLICYPSGKNLISYSIPEDTKIIDKHAFYGCVNLNSVTIPNSVQTIELKAFAWCVSLTSITIPGSVISLGHWAFDTCDNLEKVYFGGNAPSIATGTFDSTVTLYYIPGTTGWTDSAAYDDSAGTWNGYKLEVWAEMEMCTAKIGNVFFGTLEDAIKTAVKDTVIDLRKDTDETILVSKEVTINRNGFTAPNLVVGKIYKLTETDSAYIVTAYVPGDINNDDETNLKDLTRLFQYLADWDVEVNEVLLDVNGDGSVNLKDQTRLFQYLADWDVRIYPQDYRYGYFIEDTQDCDVENGPVIENGVIVDNGANAVRTYYMDIVPFDGTAGAKTVQADQLMEKNTWLQAGTVDGDLGGDFGAGSSNYIGKLTRYVINDSHEIEVLDASDWAVQAPDGAYVTAGEAKICGTDVSADTETQYMVRAWNWATQSYTYKVHIGYKNLPKEQFGANASGQDILYLVDGDSGIATHVFIDTAYDGTRETFYLLNPSSHDSEIPLYPWLSGYTVYEALLDGQKVYIAAADETGTAFGGSVSVTSGLYDAYLSVIDGTTINGLPLYLSVEGLQPVDWALIGGPVNGIDSIDDVLSMLYCEDVLMAEDAPIQVLYHLYINEQYEEEYTYKTFTGETRDEDFADFIYYSGFGFMNVYVTTESSGDGVWGDAEVITEMWIELSE